MHYIIFIVMLIALDQWTKTLIVNNFLEGETLPVILNFFHLTYVKNRGVAFGMFQGKIPIISIVTVVVIIWLIFYLFKNMSKNSQSENLGFSFIIAGALGNMIDRGMRGFVVDMVDFRGIWHYVFNAADVWINIGVFLIILAEFINTRKKRVETKGGN